MAVQQVFIRFFGILVCLFSISVRGFAQDVPPQSLRIAAASDLQWAMKECIAAFLKTHPKVRIEPVYGSSGNFVAQIRAGAPFDVFFSADVEYPRTLFQAGLTTSQPREYALGRLVLWEARTTEMTKISLSQYLQSPQVRRIAHANPAHAPYGKRAKEVLAHTFKNASELTTIESKCVLADNVAQAAQFVQTGAAECGFISLSLVLSPPFQGKGSYVVLDSALHTPLRQAVVVIKSRPNIQLSEDFVGFICSVEGAQILGKYGFRWI